MRGVPVAGAVLLVPVIKAITLRGLVDRKPHVYITEDSRDPLITLRCCREASSLCDVTRPHRPRMRNLTVGPWEGAPAMPPVSAELLTSRAGGGTYSRPHITNIQRVPRWIPDACLVTG